jgi:hypothetical protein
MVDPLLAGRVAVVSLASDLASYLTGTVIDVGVGRYT